MVVENAYDELLHNALEERQLGKIKNITNKVSDETISTLNDTLRGPEVQQLIVRSVEEKELRGDIYSSGFSGNIYVIEHPLNHKKYLAIKSRIKGGAASNLKMMKEYGFLLEAYKVINLEGSNNIKVPKPYGVLNDHDGSLLLVMDYIDGQTVFGYKTSKVLPIMYEYILNYSYGKELAYDMFQSLGEEGDYEGLKTDKEIKDKFGKLINYLRQFESESDFYKEYFSFYSHPHNRAGIMYECCMAKVYDKMKKNGLVDKNSGFKSEVIEKIKDNLASTITSIHKNNIYHNDINHRNIILGEDGYVYIIDFDKSDIHYSKNIEQSRKESTKYIASYKGTYLQGDYRCIGYFDSLVRNEDNS